MYLSARRYTSEYAYKEANEQLKPLADRFLPPDANMGSIEIKRDVGYWRKANQIHSWFVTNVQSGEDDCGYYDVSREQLETLRDTCSRVLKHCSVKKGKTIVNAGVAKELLPCVEGFFFGDGDYNDYYVDQLNDTIEQISNIIAWCDAEKALTDRKFSSVDIQYHSSW